MTTYYRELMKLQECPEELKRFISVIDCNLKRDNMLKLTPDMLWNVQRNQDMSYIMDMLCGYLNETGLLEFEGEVPIIHLKLEKSKNDIYALADMLTMAGGYKKFKGLLHIDIQDCTDNIGEAEIADILRFIRQQTDGCLRIFTASMKEYQEIEVARRISYCFRVKLIHFNRERIKGQHIFFKVKLEEAGYEITEGGSELLKLMLKQISKNRALNHYTVSMIADDFVFYMLEHHSDNMKITEAVVDGFTRDYMLIKEEEKKEQKIGFLKEE